MKREFEDFKKPSGLLEKMTSHTMVTGNSSTQIDVTQVNPTDLSRGNPSLDTGLSDHKLCAVTSTFLPEQSSRVYGGRKLGKRAWCCATFSELRSAATDDVLVFFSSKVIPYKSVRSTVYGARHVYSERRFRPRILQQPLWMNAVIARKMAKRSSF